MFDHFPELVVDITEPPFQPANVLGDAPPDHRAGEAEAILLGDQHVEELPPAGEQRVERLGGLVGQRARLGPHALGEEREHLASIASVLAS